MTFDCRIDLKDKNSEKVSRKLKVFEDGMLEEYCKWRIDYDDLVSNAAFSKPETKTMLLLSILKGKSRDSFATYHARWKRENESEEDENQNIR